MASAASICQQIPPKRHAKHKSQRRRGNLRRESADKGFGSSSHSGGNLEDLSTQDTRVTMPFSSYETRARILKLAVKDGRPIYVHRHSIAPRSFRSACVL
ncbi:hypothetical protein KP509_30G028100 [Ceratopteris richardii]|uniref:Uncharacterized protein n=1 Tax=Ceratopteris richardii TaxID=49495 RepID=A0A8T2R374_CERRI|nr:hypothetical protein KP509_30G028100 [Ceratopteris richardii]